MADSAVYLRDRLVEYVEDSEIAEVVVVTAAVAYLAATEVGYLATDPMLRWTALAVIASATGIDTMLKRRRRKASAGGGD